VTGESAPEPDRCLLAMETSAPMGSVALVRGRQILARQFLPRQGEHASHLVPAVERVLDEAAVSRSEIDGILVGKGPGSFTGVRIAAATARGLALGLGVAVWPWSSLAGAAASHGVRWPDSLVPQPDFIDLPELPEESDGWPRYVLLDARGRRVYAACYRVLPDRIEALEPPRATTVDRILVEELPANVLFCGSGALRHASLIRDAGHFILPPPAGVPTAEGIIRVHDRRPEASPVESGSRWEPDYLRSSSAGRSFVRTAGAGKGVPG